MADWRSDIYHDMKDESQRKEGEYKKDCIMQSIADLDPFRDHSELEFIESVLSNLDDWMGLYRLIKKDK